ncbi:Syntaxin-1A, partial [Perkinsus olseni]
RGVGLQQVLNKRSSTGRVEKLQDLQDQRSDIMKLERSVAEVQEMMSTLALLIDRQGGLLDNIEFDVVNAKYTADKTYRTLVDTRRNQRRAQLWMLGCGFCCFIIIALIVGFASRVAIRSTPMTPLPWPPYCTMPPQPAEKKSTLSLTRERLLAKFGKSKESVIDPVLKSYNGRAIDMTEYRKIENLVANTIRAARRKGGRNATDDAAAAAKATLSDVSSRNDPRLKPVVELPKQRPFHLQKMQAASAGKTMNAAGQYDLIVQYDSYMHALEEKDRLQSEKQKKEEYKKGLDSQMMAKRVGMANEARKREEERFAMVGANEELKRDSERRATKMKQKKLAMIQEAAEVQLAGLRYRSMQKLGSTINTAEAKKGNGGA